MPGVFVVYIPGSRVAGSDGKWICILIYILLNSPPKVMCLFPFHQDDFGVDTDSKGDSVERSRFW